MFSKTKAGPAMLCLAKLKTKSMVSPVNRTILLETKSSAY